MGCKACQGRRQRALERRRELMAAKVARLEQGCSEGRQRDCRELHNLDAADAYREQNRFRLELHRVRTTTDRPR